MYGTGYVFSKPFFTGWIIIGIIWMFISFSIVGIYPIIEGRHSIASVSKKVYNHIMFNHRSRDSGKVSANLDSKMTVENMGINNLEFSF